MQFENMLLPERKREKEKEKEHASKDMQVKIKGMYKEFLDTHKSQFHNINDANRSTLQQVTEKTNETVKGIYENLINSMESFGTGAISNFLNQNMGENIGEVIHDENWSGVMDNITKQLYETWKGGVKTVGKFFGPGGEALAELVTGLTDFVWGILKRHEKSRIKEIKKTGRRFERT